MPSILARVGAVCALGALLVGCRGGEPSATSPAVTSGSTATTTSTSVAPTSTTATTAAPSTTTTTSATQREIANLIDVTEAVRGLEFLEPVEVVVLDEEDFDARLLELLEEGLDDDELEVEAAWLELMGIIEAGTDLDSLYRDLLTEGVVGFYDHETGELAVEATSGALTPLDKITVVHELVHALTDQHFGFAAQLEDLFDAEEFDAYSGYRALVEGDAEFYSIEYFLDYMPRSEQLDAAAAALELDTAALEAAPAFITDGLVFPYVTGFDFVGTLDSVAGSSEVDAAYLDPPVSTEQVMEPQRYLEREPLQQVPLPQSVPGGFEIWEESSFGQARFRSLLGEDDPGAAAIAASGWGGDVYRILWNGSEIAMIGRFVGDTPDDAGEFAGELTEWAASSPAGTDQSRFGDAFSWVDVDGDAVAYVFASDPEIGRELADDF